MSRYIDPRRPACIALALTLAVLSTAPITSDHAAACATAFRPGARAPSVASEEALIVWDEATRTEHFIRRAKFEGAPERFGFLVPTPSRPELAEADQEVFPRLARLFTAPIPRSASTRRSASGSPLRSRPVTVVEERRIAGMQATVLTATDAQALAAWLGQNGFENRPSLAAWLAPYVRGTFHVTAFRYDALAQQTRVATQAVRLSFRTDAPFYPYAEPTDAPRVSGRRFMLSVIAPTRMDGRVGARRWAARTVYAEPLVNAANLLTGVVPNPSQYQGAWLTTFEERSSTRGRDDLSFVRAPRATRVPASID